MMVRDVRGKKAVASRLDDIEARLDILESIPEIELCRGCGGSGEDTVRNHLCTTCGGSGMVLVRRLREAAYDRDDEGLTRSLRVSDDDVVEEHLNVGFFPGDEVHIYGAYGVVKARYVVSGFRRYNVVFKSGTMINNIAESALVKRKVDDETD